ncbi:MAG TPA: crossover junction endodeoxyribonuclease RuvC [Gemmatimonadota bacterium]|nr:crossover junction endodeoxyribonuclease RuvC [Gemmatimonadota bacterium]
MIVLGVDPGAGVTGYGVVTAAERSPTLIECGAIRPAAGRPLAERLLEIFEGLTAVIDRTRPDVLCVEGVFYGRNVQTTLVLGHARGAALLSAAARGIPVAEYSPAEVKNVIVGTGAASKEQVAFMVQKHLSLEEPPAPQDAADGVALALCHIYQSRIERRTSGVGRRGR